MTQKDSFYQSVRLAYGKRLAKALRDEGWLVHDTTANHTIYIREDYSRNRDSGGMRKLFIGHHSGHCFTGDSWGHATPLPLDWPARLILKHESNAAQGKGAPAPTVAAMFAELGL